MKKSDWGLEIRKVSNGFLIKTNEGEEFLAQESEEDNLLAGEDMLNQVIEFFGLRGDKFNPECLAIIREIGRKYTPQKGEKIVKMEYFKVVKTRRQK
jgi:DNA primase large subunit